MKRYAVQVWFFVVDSEGALWGAFPASTQARFFARALEAAGVDARIAPRRLKVPRDLGRGK